MDDEKGIVEGLKIIIERNMLNCKIVGCAYNGVEGSIKIMQLKPDIVITDICMPQADGLEMIKELKNKGCEAKFIILSGHSEFEYAKKGIALGVKFYINKPVEEDELFDSINKVIEDISKEKAQIEKSIEDMDFMSYKNIIELREMQNVTRKKDVIEQVKEYIIKNYEKNITLAELSSRFFINPYYLSQLFKEKTGVMYLNFVMEIRINKARELLEKTDLKIYEICEAVGYSDTNYFSKLFERFTGCRPSEYKKKNEICRKY